MTDQKAGDTLHRRAARGASLPPCAVCGARTIQIVGDSPRCADHPFTARDARQAWHPAP
jgi:hypothetical protein